MSETLCGRVLALMVAESVNGIWTGKLREKVPHFQCSENSVSGAVEWLVNAGRITRLVRAHTGRDGQYRINDPTPLWRYDSAENGEWPRARKDRLAELYKQGHTRSVLASQMGATEAAIIGKLGRMFKSGELVKRNANYPGVPRAKVVIDLPKPNPAAIAAHDRREAVPAVVRKPVVQHPMLVDFRSSVPARPSKIRKLEGRIMSCQWPIGEPGNTGFRFCGDPSQPGRPYCEDHCKVAYVVVREKREDAA